MILSSLTQSPLCLWQKPLMLKDTWACGMNTCTLRIRPSSQTPQSAPQLSILTSQMMDTSRYTTRTNTPPGFLALVSTAMLSALLISHQASALSSSLPLSQGGQAYPTTMSLTLITKPTQSFTITMSKTCSTCGSWPGRLPSLMIWAIYWWAKPLLLFLATHRPKCSRMTKMLPSVGTHSDSRLFYQNFL